jgi:hypothetical protein
VAVSGLALAGGALASGSVVAQAGRESHGMSRDALEQLKALDDSETAAGWIDIAKGTRHPAQPRWCVRG